MGQPQSTIDILNADQVTVTSGLSVTSPKPADNSTPQVGDLYFGSFVGGAANLTVWSVPVFLPVTPAGLLNASFGGTVSLGAVSSGLPAYSLQITDSSLFVFTNINVDTAAAGSVSSSNVFARWRGDQFRGPDDLVFKSIRRRDTIRARRPSVRRRSVRQTNSSSCPKPTASSLAATPSMLSIIELDTLTDDPTQRPYPPNFWPDFPYWQFANRHNPYLDIRYQGASENDRVSPVAGGRYANHRQGQCSRRRSRSRCIWIRKGWSSGRSLAFPSTRSASPSTATG